MEILFISGPVLNEAACRRDVMHCVQPILSRVQQAGLTRVLEYLRTTDLREICSYVHLLYTLNNKHCR